MTGIVDIRSPLTLAALRAHARSRKFAARVETSLEIIRQGLIVAPDAYVSFSCGKDSAVMLHLCLQIKPDIEARFSYRGEESDILNNYQEVIQTWRERFNINLRVMTYQRPQPGLNQGKSNQFELLQTIVPADGYFVGIRKEESKRRRISLSQHGAIHRKVEDGYWRIAPLADWKLADIAAYIVMYNLPLLNSYLESGLQARTAASVPHRCRLEALTELRLRDPGAFEQLARLLPEVREWV
jgi:3'-phosphoadenosine 5'-phosphosulfate sulfotransferase (PAPS reductase)/FAD synthetase